MSTIGRKRVRGVACNLVDDIPLQSRPSIGSDRSFRWSLKKRVKADVPSSGSESICGIESLPDDVLGFIFESYFSVPEDSVTLARVSKRWQQVLSDVHLTLNAVLSDGPILSSVRLKLSACIQSGYIFQNINTLVLRGLFDLTDANFKNISGGVRGTLVHLDVRGCVK